MGAPKSPERSERISPLISYDISKQVSHILPDRKTFMKDNWIRRIEARTCLRPNEQELYEKNMQHSVILIAGENDKKTNQSFETFEKGMEFRPRKFLQEKNISKEKIELLKKILGEAFYTFQSVAILSQSVPGNHYLITSLAIDQKKQKKSEALEIGFKNLIHLSLIMEYRRNTNCNIQAFVRQKDTDAQQKALAQLKFEPIAEKHHKGWFRLILKKKYMKRILKNQQDFDSSSICFSGKTV